MRYLGNKASIVEEIYDFLYVKGLIRSDLVFFDAFCGTGSVADYFKEFYDRIVINDNLHWSEVYSRGRLCANECRFRSLGFDPIEFFNTSKDIKKGFVYNNYSPANSDRMYFTEENAGRIDFFRDTIESWKNEKKVSKNEYAYLLACLIESVSAVSNTAGVYGAFLKKWDSRAIKPIVFIPVESKQCSCGTVLSYTEKIENIIADIDCDILYMDPPYTQNQYGTQYHLF